MLDSVDYADGSYVAYKYDAFGRKISRTEAYYAKTSEFVPPGQQKESKSNGNGKGNSIKNSNSFGKGNDNTQGNGNAYGQGNGNAYGQGNGNGKNKPLKLETDTTLYSYDGLGVNVLNEYTGNGAPLGEYYYTGQSIIGKKMFGNHGLDGREPDLQTTGGLMYYQYDGLQNVSSLTNRLGEVIEDYRYDVFGNLYTGITAPYNTYGFTGMEYDPKAGLVNMHARWYAPDTGRFITPDSYSGDITQPYTQNLYAYVGNNPINRWDPMGYAESDMRSFWVDTISTSNGYIEDAYGKTGYSTSSAYSRGNPVKGSDGWYTSWTNSITEYWEYLHGHFVWEYTGETSPDFGREAICVSSYTEEVTYSNTHGTYGIDFTPFTSEEWYEEHKDDLRSYGTLPETRPKSITGTFAYNNFDSSSATDILFSVDGNEPINDTQTTIIKDLLRKAIPLNSFGIPTVAMYDPGIGYSYSPEYADPSQGTGNSGVSINPADYENDPVIQAGYKEAQIILEAILDEYHQYKWPSGYYIADKTWAAIYKNSYDSEVNRAKKIADFFDTFNIANDIREAYEEVSRNAWEGDPYAFRYNLAGAIIYGILSNAWDTGEPGIGDLPEVFGINGAMNKSIARELEKYEYINNSVNRYLVSGSSARNMFINKISELEILNTEKTFIRYDNKLDNEKYKQALLRYLGGVKSMNIDYINSSVELTKVMIKIDAKY